MTGTRSPARGRPLCPSSRTSCRWTRTCPCRGRWRPACARPLTTRYSPPSGPPRCPCESTRRPRSTPALLTYMPLHSVRNPVLPDHQPARPPGDRRVGSGGMDAIYGPAPWRVDVGDWRAGACRSEASNLSLSRSSSPQEEGTAGSHSRQPHGVPAHRPNGRGGGAERPRGLQGLAAQGSRHGDLPGPHRAAANTGGRLDDPIPGSDADHRFAFAQNTVDGLLNAGTQVILTT